MISSFSFFQVEAQNFEKHDCHRYINSKYARLSDCIYHIYCSPSLFKLFGDATSDDDCSQDTEEYVDKQALQAPLSQFCGVVLMGLTLNLDKDILHLDYQVVQEKPFETIDNRIESF